MTTPKRVQLKRAKGWTTPPGVVVVDRRTKWGNWYQGDLAAETFRAALAALYAGRPVCIEARVYPPVEEIRAELGGKDLGCWCPPGQECHADSLLVIANGGVL